MVLAALVLNVLIAVLEQACQFAQRFLGQDRLDLVPFAGRRRTAVAAHADQCETMPVGCHQAHDIGLQHEERTIEKVARIFPGDRKLRSCNHVPHGSP